jgi:hypothetical protein
MYIIIIRIEYILQLIQTIFKSEKEKDKIERLHVPSSKRYVDFVNKFNLNFLYWNNQLSENKLNEEQNRVMSVVKTTDNLIKNFCDSILNHAEDVEAFKKSEKYDKSEENNIKPFVWDFKINPEEVFIKLFKNEYKDRQSIKSEYVLNPVDLSKLGNGIMNNDDNFNTVDNNENDVNLNSFMSTLKFIEELCTISERMKDIQPNDQMGFLRREITEINKSLPANVYAPFLKDSLRNYLVCHIPITELKIFRTKNRAPFLITIEVIRIDEIISSLPVGRNQNTSKDEYKTDIVSPAIKTQRIRSHSMIESVKDLNTSKVNFTNKNDISYDITKKNKEISYSKTFVETKLGRNRSHTMRLVAESDVQLSKPVTIFNIEIENKNKPMRTQNTIIEEEEDLEDESYLKGGVNEYVKRRLTAYQTTSKHRLSVNIDSTNVNQIKQKLEEEPMNMNDKLKSIIKNNENDEGMIIFKQRGRNFTTTEGIVKDNNLLNFEEKKSNSNLKMSTGSVEKDECKEINYDNTLENKKFENVFGESAEEQSERIRKSSPFGEFNSWKTFRMISNNKTN